MVNLTPIRTQIVISTLPRQEKPAQTNAGPELNSLTLTLAPTTPGLKVPCLSVLRGKFSRTHHTQALSHSLTHSLTHTHTHTRTRACACARTHTSHIRSWSCALEGVLPQDDHLSQEPTWIHGATVDPGTYTSHTSLNSRHQPSNHAAEHCKP